MYRWNESGLCYTSGGIEKGTWVKILNPDGRVNAETLLGILADAAGKNSWNLTTGEMNLSAESTFGGKTLENVVGELMPDVSETLNTALTSYDEGLNQAKVLEKLQNGDTGFYLGADGLLHMLPERVVTDGANVPVAYLPTTIVDGAVTSYTQVRIVNGILYPPLETEPDPGTGEGTTGEGTTGETGSTDNTENSAEEVS